MRPYTDCGILVIVMLLLLLSSCQESYCYHQNSISLLSNLRQQHDRNVVEDDITTTARTDSDRRTARRKVQEHDVPITFLNRTMISYTSNNNHNNNDNNKMNYLSYPVELVVSSTVVQDLEQQQHQQQDLSSFFQINPLLKFNIMFLPKGMETLCDPLPTINMSIISSYMDSLDQQVMMNSKNNHNKSMNDDTMMFLPIAILHPNVMSTSTSFMATTDNYHYDTSTNGRQPPDQQKQQQTVCSYYDMLFNIFQLNMNLPFMTAIKYVILPMSYLHNDSSNKTNSSNSVNNHTNQTDDNHNLVMTIEEQFMMNVMNLNQTNCNNDYNDMKNSYMDDMLTIIFMADNDLNDLNQTINFFNSNNNDNVPNPYLFQSGNAQWSLRYMIQLDNSTNTTFYDNDNHNYKNNNQYTNHRKGYKMFHSWYGLLNLLIILSIMTCILRSYCIHHHYGSEDATDAAYRDNNSTEMIAEHDFNRFIASIVHNTTTNQDSNIDYEVILNRNNQDEFGINREREVYSLSLDDFNRLPIIQYETPNVTPENHYNDNNVATGTNISTSLPSVMPHNPNNITTECKDDVDYNSNDDLVAVPHETNVSSTTLTSSATITTVANLIGNRQEEEDEGHGMGTMNELLPVDRLAITTTTESSPTLPISSCTSCSICLDDFIPNESLIILPQCKHIYHNECIKQWLLEKHSILCPLCKTDVLTMEQKENKRKQYIQHRIQIQTIRRQLLLRQYNYQEQQQAIFHHHDEIRRHRTQQIEMRMLNPLVIVLGNSSNNRNSNTMTIISNDANDNSSGHISDQDHNNLTPTDAAAPQQSGTVSPPNNNQHDLQ